MAPKDPAPAITGSPHRRLNFAEGVAYCETAYAWP